jgi:hypothetical protein
MVSCRHSRECGNPVSLVRKGKTLGPRIREGDDGELRASDDGELREGDDGELCARVTMVSHRHSRAMNPQPQARPKIA